MSIIRNKKEIQDILNAGGVISFVTDTVWGLGCLPDNRNAVKKIYDIKKREAQKPLILMSSNIDNLKPYVREFSDKAKELSDKFLPGALTLVLPKSDKTPDYITSNFDTVGIRVPDNDVFKEISELAKDKVLATTSANLSNEPSAKTYYQALDYMKNKADLIIEDYGHTAKGTESTVILVLNNEIKILRQGQINIL